MADFYGVAGVALIFIGWSVELVRTLQKRQAQVPLAFAVLYGIGSVLLIIHSIILDDVPFMLLNSAAALIALVNIWFYPMQRKTGK